MLRTSLLPFALLPLASLAGFCHEPAFIERMAIASEWQDGAQEPPPAEVARQLGNGIAAIDSCVTAVYLGLRYRSHSFLDMLAFIAKAGGDVDTIGAMAGSIWRAANGAAALPSEALHSLEQRDRLEEVAKRIADL